MKPLPGSQLPPGSSVILMPPRLPRHVRKEATRPVTTPAIGMKSPVGHEQAVADGEAA
jgi:hypothetical protein